MTHIFLDTPTSIKNHTLHILTSQTHLAKVAVSKVFTPFLNVFLSYFGIQNALAIFMLFLVCGFRRVKARMWRLLTGLCSDHKIELVVEIYSTDMSKGSYQIVHCFATVLFYFSNLTDFVEHFERVAHHAKFKNPFIVILYNFQFCWNPGEHEHTNVADEADYARGLTDSAHQGFHHEQVRNFKFSNFKKKIQEPQVEAIQATAAAAARQPLEQHVIRHQDSHLEQVQPVVKKQRNDVVEHAQRGEPQVRFLNF